MALTTKQELFVSEFLKDLNATQAAIRAGYPKKAAYAMGYENLKKPQIQAELKKKLEPFVKKNDLSIDKVISEISKYAFLPASDSNDSEFKHASKTKYLEMLAKYLGMYEQKTTINIQTNNLLEAIRTSTEINTDDLSEV